MNLHIKKQIIWAIKTAILTLIGLLLLKYLPMEIYGKDILFDASSHIAWTSFGIYVLWFFIDQSKFWRIPYLIFSSMILTLMAIQRIIVGEHNEVGVLLGFFVAGIAIIIPRWNEFRKNLKF